MIATASPAAEADREIGDIDSYVARCRAQKEIAKTLAMEAMEKAFTAHLSGGTRMRIHVLLRTAEDHIQGEDYWAAQEFQWMASFVTQE